MTPRDDPARDAWLSQALRHAPDADAAPPADVSEAILRAARQAVKPAGNAPRRTHPLLQLWNWLARPPVAAAFATLMVATLIGVMWWDKPLDETLSRPAATPPPAEAGSTAAAPPPTPSPAPTPAAARPAASPAAQDNSAATGRGAADSARATSPRPDQTTAAPKRERKAAQAVAESAARVADAATPAATPAQQPAAAAAPPPAAAPAPAREAPEVRAMAKAAAPMREEADAASASGALGRAAPAASLALRRPDPAASVLPVIGQTDHWTWRRNAGLQPMTPGLQAWLTQLERAAQWRSASGEPAPAGDATVLQLWRDGALRGSVALGSDRVWFTPASGPAMTSPLSPATAAALRAALVDAAP